MLNQFSRTQLLLGRPAIERLANCRVAVFGIGGVGGYVCEALVRSGVGAFDLIDDDQVCLTNLNRQIMATRRTVGKYKAEVMAERMLEINPQADIRVRKCFVLPENAHEFPFGEYDYVVDAIDTVSAKLCLAEQARTHGVPIISAMGAGNKMDPGRFRISDITRTHTCPLARVMRRELRKRGIPHLKVIWSDEPPIRPIEDMSISCRSHCICPPEGRFASGKASREATGDGSILRIEARHRAKHKCTERRDIPGSTAFVPAVAGLMIAAEVIRDLTRDCPREA